MPEHDTHSFILGGIIEYIRESHVHARRHRVLPCRTIQLNAKHACGTFGDNLVHRPLLLGPDDVSALASDHYAARSFAFGTAPLSRKPSISLVPKPSSARTASLCSPSAGARLAGTFATPRTLIGLLIVEVSVPPAPSS